MFPILEIKSDHTSMCDIQNLNISRSCFFFCKFRFLDAFKIVKLLTFVHLKGRKIAQLQRFMRWYI